MLETGLKVYAALSVFLSLVSLSVAFNNKEVKDLINHRVSKAKTHGTILLSLLSLLVVSSLVDTLFGTNFLSISVFTMLSALIYFEIWDLKVFFENSYVPGLKREVLDVLAYLSLLWLLTKHIDLSINLLMIFSLIFIVITIYYSFRLGEYIRIYSSVVVPIDLFPTYLASRFFSLSFAFHVLTYGFDTPPFTLLTIAGYGVLAVSMLTAARKIGELKTVKF